MHRALPRIATLAAVLPLMIATANAAPAPPAGDWRTDGGQSVVRFEPCGQGWCGRINRILKTDPGASPHDIRNPDEALRKRPVLGLRILHLTKPEGDRWKGTVYDPRSGKTYKAVVRRVSAAQLDVQGCLMMFCQTQRWSAN